MSKLNKILKTIKAKQEDSKQYVFVQNNTFLTKKIVYNIDTIKLLKKSKKREKEFLKQLEQN